MKSVLLFLIKQYEKIKPQIAVVARTLFGVSNYSCRFTPTCSRYLYEAIEKYGAIKGLSLGLKRILRCHPLNKSSHFDPVN
ncbi:MAG: membrane protein insertion efficiency factor YidD [Candidatus Roizmanbacteria bacterium]